MFHGHRGWVQTIELLTIESKNATWLFSGGAEDNSVLIWDVESGKLLDRLSGHDAGITCIAFANNDMYTGSYDHNIICWDLQELDGRIEEK